LLEVLEEWNPASFDPHPLYELIKGVLHFRTGNYKVAAKILEGADIPSQPLSEWEKSPYTYMLSKALQYSGQHGRSVAMWKEIINDPNHSERGTSVYFKALFDLSGYYLRKEDFNKAKATLVNIKEAFMEYMQESRGEQYFTLLGDISLGEGDCLEALEFYEKAFSISPSGDVADKIKLLKK
jgi:tetratricopeptide (TPR) repeat protein